MGQASFLLVKKIQEERLTSRLRVVPHFSSGIIERAKRERRENHPTREKATRGGEREKIIFLSPLYYP